MSWRLCPLDAGILIKMYGGVLGRCICMMSSSNCKRKMEQQESDANAS